MVNREAATVGSRTGKSWILSSPRALVLGPALVFGMVTAAAALFGVAIERGCNPLTVLSAALSRPTSLAGCSEVTWLVDFASVTLFISCAIAAMEYYYLVARLKILVDEVVATGLIDPNRYLEEPARRALDVLQRRLRSTRLIDVAAGTFAAACGVALYVVTYGNGYIFSILGRVYLNNGADVDISVMHETWWPAFESRPMLAVLWVVIVTLGTFYALRIGYIKSLVTMFLIRHGRSIRVNYVAQWVDRDFGWRPTGGLLISGYVGSISIMITLSALFYMLRADEPGGTRNLVLATIAIVGISANVLFLLSVRIWIRRSFQSTLDEKRAELINDLRQGVGTGEPLTRLSQHLRSIELSNTPSFPISAGRLGTASIVTFILAFVRFVADLFGLVT